MYIYIYIQLKVYYAASGANGRPWIMGILLCKLIMFTLRLTLTSWSSLSRAGNHLCNTELHQQPDKTSWKLTLVAVALLRLIADGFLGLNFGASPGGISLPRRKGTITASRVPRSV